jgi:hypothetical protein
MKTFAGDLEGCSGVYRGGLNQNANHERARSNRYLDLFAGSEGRFAKPLYHIYGDPWREQRYSGDE